MRTYVPFYPATGDGSDFMVQLPEIASREQVQRAFGRALGLALGDSLEHIKVSGNAQSVVVEYSPYEIGVWVLDAAAPAGELDPIEYRWVGEWQAYDPIRDDGSARVLEIYESPEGSLLGIDAVAGVDRYEDNDENGLSCPYTGNPIVLKP